MASPWMESADGFFQSYSRAFVNFDASAIADHFAYPLHITSDGDEVMIMPVAARDQWVGQIDRLLDAYAKVGVRSATVQERTVSELSARLCQVTLRWALYDVAGDLLYNFHATYTLAEVDDALRITALAHNELPRLRDCLARLPTRQPGGERPTSYGN